jgi:hypothetical protein
VFDIVGMFPEFLGLRQIVIARPALALPIPDNIFSCERPPFSQRQTSSAKDLAAHSSVWI